MQMFYALMKLSLCYGPIIFGPEIGDYYLGEKGWYAGFAGGIVVAVIAGLYFILMAD